MGRNGKLVLFTDTRLFEYDPVSKNTNLLLEVSGSWVSCAAVCFDAEGLPWLATDQGLYRRDPGGTWTHWTTADGLVSNYINDIIEYEYPDGKHSIWIATYEGISEYKYNENTWVTYTTAQGLPSNTVFKFALDGAGDLWISTYNGLVKYGGTSFSGVNAPFGTDPVYYKLSGSSDGSVWMATSYKLYRYRSGTWSQWKQSNIAYRLYIAEIAADDTSVWFRGSDILVKYEAGNFTVYRSTSEPKIERVNAAIPFAGPGIWH
jgi:ligand-binding sensor domain-containing protein